MTAQFCSDLHTAKGFAKKQAVWVVGSGPTLDDIDISLFDKEFIFVLNTSIALFDMARYENAWWLAHDNRVYNEVRKNILKFNVVRAITHKRLYYQMREYKGNLRILLYEKKAFNTKETILECALKFADMLGFQRAYLVGIDGKVAKNETDPYARKLKDVKKNCYFMIPGKPGTYKPSSDRMVEQLKELKRELNIEIFQTSPMYPDKETFQFIEFKDALLRERELEPKRKKKKIRPSA